MAATLEEQVREKPKDHRLRLDLAKLQESHGQIEEAVTSAQMAAQLNRRHHPWLIEVGNYLLDIGANEAAVSVFQGAVEIAPISVTALNGYGRSLTLTGRYEAAQQAHELALRQSPRNKLTQMLLANLVANPEAPLESSEARLRVTFKGQ